MQVLFVEDDAMNRRVVADMLRVAGIDMDEAEEAETGLRMIALGHYDLILMDLRMPGMDGLSAIRELRAGSDATSRLPVIVVTADSAPDLGRRCSEAGADYVIQKPVAMAQLLETISLATEDLGDVEVMID